MTQNDLREKVINAEAKVAKRKAVLKKHREQLAKLIQKGADEFDISIKKDDIESAKRKLEEAEKILNNWKEKLDERITADDYLEANAPEKPCQTNRPARTAGHRKRKEQNHEEIPQGRRTRHRFSLRRREVGRAGA